MNKPNLSLIGRSVRSYVVRHSPEIMTSLAIGGMLTTTVLAVKATPKALLLLEEKKKEERVDKLTPIEAIKTTWKCYVPAAVTGVLSAGCMICANSVNLKRNAALAAAYSVSETALKEYQEKVIETIGEKKEQGIREAIAKDRIDKNPMSTKEVIITGSGETYFYDPTSDRYFTADIENVRRIVNDLNERMLNGIESHVSLNDFYEEIGLRYTLVGDEVGWNVSKWGQIKLEFHAQIADNGKPCLVLDFSQNAPRRDYDKYM